MAPISTKIQFFRYKMVLDYSVLRCVSLFNEILRFSCYVMFFVVVIFVSFIVSRLITFPDRRSNLYRIVTFTSTEEDHL